MSKKIRILRQLERYHVRIVQNSGKSCPMDDLYPEVEALTEFQ